MKNTATTATTATTFEVRRIIANDRLTAEATEIIDAYNRAERPHTLQLEFLQPVDITDRRNIELALETLECNFISDDAKLVDILTEAADNACPCFFRVYYPDVIS